MQALFGDCNAIWKNETHTNNSLTEHHPTAETDMHDANVFQHHVSRKMERTAAKHYRFCNFSDAANEILVSICPPQSGVDIFRRNCQMVKVRDFGLTFQR